MKYQRGLALLSLAAVCAQLGCALAASAPARQELGRQVKLRILVDKVMQPTEGWVTKEWMVKATAEAGFNVFSPRRGHDNLDEVRRVTQWCEKHGLYHMPWMRGSLNAPQGHEAYGKRVVWADGTEQPLWSPNSDEFWAWTTRYIVEYARMNAGNKHLMGVFLDYENYEKGGRGNLYSLSYDELILGKFAQARAIQLPKLKPAERAEWLKKQNLHDAFAAFQIAHWRERCRGLRKAVDAHDPTFQFCIYPAPGTPFMVEAVYPEWATEAAPLILADASTYGRPSRFLPEAESVKGNRQTLLENRKIPRERGIPHIYTGGIDPVVRGADPEFCGKNAVAISDVTDGYWVFYEGPKYSEDHPAYWKWFTWANRAIAVGNFAAQHEPRQTPDNWSFDLLQRLGKEAMLLPPPVTGETVPFPVVKLRQENLLLIGAKVNTPVAVALRHHPVARYESPLRWELHDPGRKRIASGAIPHGASGEVRFTPATDGVYFLAASAGPCAYSVESREPQTVEQIIAHGYFATPRAEPELALISDRQHTSRLGLEDAIHLIRQRYEVYERNIYDIEVSKCSAVNSLLHVMAERGEKPADSKEAYSLNKALQKLYQEAREERVSLWQDVARVRQTLPEVAQLYLSAYRKMEILNGKDGDAP